MDDWMQRRDEGGRLTYPPLLTKGGNPNAEAKEGIIQGVAFALTRTKQQEAEFRARQYTRRLRTRGLAAMQSIQEGTTSVEPFVPPPNLPADPEVDPYRAAGWL